MLLGTFAPKLDEKNRLVLPARFWDEFSGGIVMTRGQEHSVFLYSQREFEDLHGKLREASLTSKRARDFLRVFLSGASQEIPDKQRRITVPQLLRDYAGLGRDLTVIGAGTRAEIWDTAAWNSYLSESESAFSDTDEEVIPGIF